MDLAKCTCSIMDGENGRRYKGKDICSMTEKYKIKTCHGRSPALGMQQLLWLVLVVRKLCPNFEFGGGNSNRQSATM
jgi:hypothetical protein